MNVYLNIHQNLLKEAQKNSNRWIIKWLEFEIEETKNSELINPILTFKRDCIKEGEGSKRVGVKKVREAYNTWCKKNCVKEYKKLKDFRENFEKITGLKRSKTNIRGYKIELKIKLLL